MDDAAITALLDEDELDYDEDVSLSSVKLVVGFAGVGASLVSHAFPAPFPKNWWVLLYCRCAWSLLLQRRPPVHALVHEQNILLVQGKRSAAATTTAAAAAAASVARASTSRRTSRASRRCTRWRSALPKGRDGAVERAQVHAPNRPPKPTDEPSYVGGAFQQSWACNHYFDEEGYFDEDSFVDVRRRERQSPRRPHRRAARLC